MNLKKLILFFSVLLFILCTRLYTSSAQEYNENFQIKSITLKISLIETAYEMYNINLNNSTSYEELYKNSSKEGYRHYKWIKNTYESMDLNMKKRLGSIFKNNTSWDYINEVINLKDNATIDEIVQAIINSKNLDLNSGLKKDIELFFNYFYAEHFSLYFNKLETSYINKSSNINKIIYKKNINILKFIESTSDVNLNKYQKIVFYYDFNPIQSQVIKDKNTIISTIQFDTNIYDLISISFYQFSHYIFDTYKDSTELLEVYKKLNKDSYFISKYEKIGKDYYDFNIWCKENLVTGFSKYLNYRFFQVDSNFSSYAYDLDFYNYLREINFNPKSKSLLNTSLDFYNNKINLINGPTN